MCLTSRSWVSRLVPLLLIKIVRFQLQPKITYFQGLKTSIFYQYKRDQPRNPTPWSKAHVKVNILFTLAYQTPFQNQIFNSVWQWCFFVTKFCKKLTSKLKNRIFGRTTSFIFRQFSKLFFEKSWIESPSKCCSLGFLTKKKEYLYECDRHSGSYNKMTKHTLCGLPLTQGTNSRFYNSSVDTPKMPLSTACYG